MRKNGVSLAKKLAVIGGGIVGFGIIISAFPKISVYIEAPKKIEAVAGEVKSIQDYIKEQQVQNQLLRELYQQYQQSNQQYTKPPPYHPPPPSKENIESFCQEGWCTFDNINWWRQM